jgi:8-oxo-dGTP pyrophosphatase MutT (NUDIX family)
MHRDRTIYPTTLEPVHGSLTFGINANRDFQTRPAGVELDGVGIVAILDKEGGSELLLQKQYRPPVDKVVIEVPAGLIDAGETPEQCAVRELLEETGYVGVAQQTSPVMFNGEFWLCICVGREFADGLCRSWDV